MASFATILEAVPPKHDAVKKLMLKINNQVQIIRSRSDSQQDLKVAVLVKAVAMMCLVDVLCNYARDSKVQDYSNSFVNNKIKQEAEALDACRIEEKINDLCQKNKAMEIVFEKAQFPNSHIPQDNIAEFGDTIGKAWVAHIKTLESCKHYLNQMYKGLEGEFGEELRLTKKVKRWFRR
jgi:predicted metallopeptidase